MKLRKFSPGGAHTGTSGFTNYFGKPPPKDDVWKEFPGSIIVDGDDDWYAPDHMHPPALCRKYKVEPLALYHSGISGISSSGVVLSSDGFKEFERAYREQFSCEVTARGLRVTRSP